MAANRSSSIYSATYSNVPVYEFTLAGAKHVMRRRADDWINATHILKVADYDKPARTRILEREVQKGVHEKVQGGYGKYQGTWIPLHDGRELAAKNGVLDVLLPIFTFVPGDRSPPPAPKHATAASSKPRAPRAGGAQRKAPAPAPAPVYRSHVNAHEPDPMDMSMMDETPDHETVASESQFGDVYANEVLPPPTGARKRRRVEDPMSQADKDHQLWAEELLDYFMLQDNPLDSLPAAPAPPANVNLNRAIDERGHTALHWAAAMGDIEVVKDLIRLGAQVDVQSKNGETPLMRSVIFTNCFDKRCMEKLASLLVRTVNMQEWFGSTVFHHIAGITQSKKKYECARYYMDCILNKMAEVLSTDKIERILNETDNNGDTAITIAARNGARKCVRSLIGRNAAVDIPNAMGETADQLIVQLNHRRQERNRQLSSSPFQADPAPHLARAVGPPLPHPFNAALHLNNSAYDPLLTSSSSSPPDLYKSEAALTLTSSLLPTLVAKTRTLASSLDAELAEKDAELAEAERLVRARRAECDALRVRAEELHVRELEQTSAGAETDEGLAGALAGLERECEGLVAEEEGWILRGLVDGELAGANKKEENGQPLQDSGDRIEVGRQLVALQRERGLLLKEIVRCMGLAGAEEGNGDGDANEGSHNRSGSGHGGASSSSKQRQQQYQRLITGALGVREEDVVQMLPEIVAELEEWRGLEGVDGGAGVDVGIGGVGIGGAGVAVGA